MFCINHNVPFTSFSDFDCKESFPNFPSYPKLLTMISELKIEVPKIYRNKSKRLKMSQ